MSIPAADTGCFTVLRDPVDRVISHYYHLTSAPRHPEKNKKHYRCLGLSGYVTTDPRRDTDNDQVRRLSGVGGRVPKGEITRMMLDTAKENLARHCAVVGDFADFNAVMLLLRHTFQWHDFFPVRGNDAFRFTKDAVSDSLREKIREQNRFDYELYDFGRKLFQKALSQYPGDMGEEKKIFPALSIIARMMLSTPASERARHIASFFSRGNAQGIEKKIIRFLENFSREETTSDSAYAYKAARMFHLLGKENRALLYYQQVIDCSVNQSFVERARFHMAEIAYYKKDYTCAAELLRRCVQNNPGHYRAGCMLDSIMAFV